MHGCQAQSAIVAAQHESYMSATTIQQSIAMSANSPSFFSSVSRAVLGIAETFSIAREMQTIADTPEHVFRARGTSRDAALRAMAKRL